MMKIQINNTGTYYVIARNNISGYKSLPSNKVTFFSNNNCFRTISDVFPDPYENGIFEFIRNSHTKLGDFLDSIYPKSILDVEYVFKRSGSKRLSTLFEGFFRTNKQKSSLYPLSDKQMNILCNIFNARYYEKWSKAYATIIAEFDPLAPYNMDISDKTTDVYASDENSSYVDNNINNRNVYGFNSDVATPSDNGSGEATGKSINTRSRTTDNTREIVRKGNIGNVTMQQLTEQQREMLQWQLWDVIFADTDKLLTRPTYG